MKDFFLDARKPASHIHSNQNIPLAHKEQKAVRTILNVTEELRLAELRIKSLNAYPTGPQTLTSSPAVLHDDAGCGPGQADLARLKIP